MDQNLLAKLEAEQRIRAELDKFSKYSDIIKEFKVGLTKLHVYYTNGLQLHKHIDKLDPYTIWINTIRQGHEYNVFPGQDNTEDIKKFFRISKAQLERAGFADKEVAIHRLVKQLVDESWVHLQYPTAVLKDDWEINYTKYIAKNKLILSPASLSKTINGWYIQSSFYNYGNQSGIKGRTYKQAWKDASFLYKMIIKLVNSGREVTRTNLNRIMNSTHLSYKNRIGRKFRSPGFYLALFKMLNLEFKHIHDMHPVNWAKAVASTKANIHYTFEPDQNALYEDYNEFVDEVGGISNTNPAELYDVNPDVVIMDNNLESEAEVGPYLPLLGRRFKMLIATSNKPSDDSIPVSYFDRQEPAMFLKIYT